jgi:hypothetical protein
MGAPFLANYPEFLDTENTEFTESHGKCINGFFRVCPRFLRIPCPNGFNHTVLSKLTDN